MDHDSPAPLPESAAGASRTPAAIEVQRERMRAELIAAAEAEAAAIVEGARSEITATAFRARRDLLLIRAQLQLCGIEPPAIVSSELEMFRLAQGDTLQPLNGDPAADTIVDVDHSTAGVSEDPAVLPDSFVSERAEPEIHPESEVPDVMPPPRSRRRFPRTLTRPSVIAVAVSVLFVLGGITGWMYSGANARVAARASTVSKTVPGDAGDPSNVADAKTPTETAGSPVPSPPRVVVQVTRPVWMRLDVDGSGDVGRLYQAGETKELNPREALVIRAGDAGAVMLAVQGGPMTTLGPAGQVMTRRISIVDGAPPAKNEAAATPPPVSPSAPPVSGPVDRPAIPPSLQTSTSTPVASEPPARPASTPRSAESEQELAVLASHSQWLEAYARGDDRAVAAITAEGFSMRDERTGRNGTPVAAITPSQVSDIRVDVAGTGAVLTARLRTSVGGVVSESLLSEVWVRRDQQRWGLMGVRITPVENVPPTVR